MKKFLFFCLSIVFLLALASCQGQRNVSENIIKDEASGFTLITDTVWLDLEQLGISPKEGAANYDLIHVVKYRGQYKFLFGNDADSLILTTLDADFRQMNDRFEVSIPRFMLSYALPIFVRNDSLLLKLRGKGSPYLYFNCDSLTAKVVKMNSRLSKKDAYRHVECYMDRDCIIDYLDDGEFGQFVTFFDRNSDRSSCFAMPMHYVRFWHGAYYFVSPCNIFRIDNPFEARETFKQRYRPVMDYSFVKAIEKLSLKPDFNGWYIEINHLSHTPVSTTYKATFVHKDCLYVVENRLQDGLYLMQLVESDSLKEILRISDAPVSPNYLVEQVPEVLCPQNYTLLPMQWTEQYLGFLEISSDTVRKVFLKFEKPCGSL